MQSTSSSSRNPETWHLAHTYQGKKCGHFQRIIIACIWDSCDEVEEGSCLLSSGMLKGYTGLLSGCTSNSWWSSRESCCINENMGIFWGMAHLSFTVQERGESIRGGKKGGPCAVRNEPDLLVLVWEARRACVNKYQFMMFWTKKDYPLRKSNLCLCMYMLCLGKYGWSRAALNVELWTPGLQF